MVLIKRHWREYAIEALCLGLFMAAACGFGVLLEHPASPARRALPDGDLRRLLMGCAMGLTAIALIYSPPGRRSGAHMNPAVTLTFFRLGKVATADACGYALGQFAGALAGVALMAGWLGARLADPAVHYVATLPGRPGPAAAFGCELAISCAQMGIVLAVSNSRWARLTGVCAGTAVAAWIYWVAPVSGMSMNPARTLGSAAPAHDWRWLWIYFTAPPAGMLLAGELYLRAHRCDLPACAKLHHAEGYPCVFCEHAARQVAATHAGQRPPAEREPSL